MPCLLVRQPYASLIAYGLKRAEFRPYPTVVRGLIGIAASKGSPLRTLDATLNSAARGWPRGQVLATGILSEVEFWDNRKLRLSATNKRDIWIHGTRIRVYDVPLGEPVDDVNLAIGRDDWRSWAWILQDVTGLNRTVKYSHAGKSTWGQMLSQ